MVKLKDTVKRLNEILSKNDLSLIDEFEEEFIKLEYKGETSSIVIFKNRELVRNAYFLITMAYGEKATLREFDDLINYNCSKDIFTLHQKIKYKNRKLVKQIEYVTVYFMNNYYSKALPNNTYKECMQTRYWVNKMVNIMNIENGDYSELEPHSLFEEYI